MRRLFLSSVVCLALIGSGSVRAAGIPVVDISAIQNIINTIRVIQQQISMLTGLIQQGQQIYSALGQTGSYSLQGFAPIAPALTSTIGQFSPNPCGQFNCASGVSNPDFTNYNSTRTWASSTFYTQQDSSYADKEAAYDRRVGAGQAAAEDGYSLALAGRAIVGQAPGQAAQMEAAVNGASSVRDDVKANTNVLLQIYGQDAQELAILSSLLQVESSRLLANDRSSGYNTQATSQSTTSSTQSTTSSTSNTSSTSTGQ